MNRAAPPAPPEAQRTAAGRGNGRDAILVAIRGGLIAFVLTAVAAQVVPLAIDVFGGGLALPTGPKLGWFYELAFHRVPIEVTGAGGVTGRVTIAFLSGTALVLWLLFRAGRTAAQRAGPSVSNRVLTGAVVGPAYALPIAVVTSFVRLQLATGGPVLPATVELHAVAWQAFVLPALLGVAAGGAGGLLVSVPAGSRVRAWVTGGWRGVVSALGLAAIGVLMLAAIRPEGTATYARTVSNDGTDVAALILGHHALLLPNQSFFVLGPSMGGCIELAGTEATISILCPGRLPILDAPTVLDDVARVGGADANQGDAEPDRTMPAVYWLFLLVPTVATVAAGRSAGRAASRIGGTAERVVRGAGAGVVFAVVVGAGTWMASVSVMIHAADGPGTTSFTLGPRPATTTLLALVWGVAGGALGAWSVRQEEGTPVPVEPDAPVPPSPTSV